MKEIYLDDNGAPAGPYPLDQVRELLGKGIVTLDHLASSTGTAPWKPLRDFPEFLQRISPISGREEETFLVSAIDAVVEKIASPFGKDAGMKDRYQAYLMKVCAWGAYGLLACGVLALLFSVVEAARTGNVSPLGFGVAFLVVMAIGHYFAVKFSAANLSLLRSDEVQLGSTAFPSSMAILSLPGALLLPVVAVVAFLAMVGTSFAGAIGVAIFALYVAVVSFHVVVLSANCGPLLNVGTRALPVTGGESFTALLKFFARLQLSAGIVAFAYGVATAFLLILFSGLAEAFGRRPSYYGGGLLSGLNIPDIGSVSSTGAGFGWGIFLAALPAILYVAYLLAILAVDVLAAIFRIARNTDRIP